MMIMNFIAWLAMRNAERWIIRYKENYRRKGFDRDHALEYARKTRIINAWKTLVEAHEKP